MTIMAGKVIIIKLKKFYNNLFLINNIKLI